MTPQDFKERKKIILIFKLKDSQGLIGTKLEAKN